MHVTSPLLFLIGGCLIVAFVAFLYYIRWGVGLHTAFIEAGREIEPLLPALLPLVFAPATIFLWLEGERIGGTVFGVLFLCSIVNLAWTVTHHGERDKHR